MPRNTLNVKIDVSDSGGMDNLAKALEQTGRSNVTAGFRQGGFQSMESAVAFQQKMNEQLGGLRTGVRSQITQQADDSYSVSGSSANRKAFGPGGYLAGVATTVGAIATGFKKLLDMSSIVNTFMSTTGKIIGAAMDVMLAPLVPVFTRILMWIVKTVFPIADKVGDWLGGLGTTGTAAALVAGYVGVKFTQKILETAGNAIATAIGNALPTDTIGRAIATGFSSAKDLLADWAETGALYLLEGVTTMTEMVKNWYEAIGTGISSAMTVISDSVKAWYDAIGEGISTAMSVVSDTVKDWYEKIGIGISSAMSVVTDTVSNWYKKIGTGIQTAMTVASDTVSTWYKAVGTGIQTAMTVASDTVSDWYKAVGTGIQTAMTVASDTLSTWYDTVASGIGTALSAVGTAWEAVGDFIARGMELASGALRRVGNAIGNAVGGAMSSFGGLGKMGGLIGAGIGVVAIGGAIGYHMWKKYREYEEGRDITTGLSDIQLMRRLQDEYGLGRTAARGLIDPLRKAVGEGEGMRVDTESMGKMAVAMKDITDSFLAFDRVDDQTMDMYKALLVPEQNVVKTLIGGGAFNLTDAQAKALLEVLGAVKDSAATVASANVSSDFYYSSLTHGQGAFSRGMIGHDATTQLGMRQEKLMRQQLEDLGVLRGGESIDYLDKNWLGTQSLATGFKAPGWENELTDLESLLGFWVSAARGNTMTGMLSPEGLRELNLGSDYTKEDLSRITQTVNLRFELNGVPHNVSPSDFETIKSWINQGYEFTGVTSVPE